MFVNKESVSNYILIQLEESKSNVESRNGNNLSIKNNYSEFRSKICCFKTDFAGSKPKQLLIMNFKI